VRVRKSAAANPDRHGYEPESESLQTRLDALFIEVEARDHNLKCQCCTRGDPSPESLLVHGTLRVDPQAESDSEFKLVARGDSDIELESVVQVGTRFEYFLLLFPSRGLLSLRLQVKVDSRQVSRIKTY
jgi:hypothetical protein